MPRLLFKRPAGVEVQATQPSVAGPSPRPSNATAECIEATRAQRLDQLWRIPQLAAVAPSKIPASYLEFSSSVRGSIGATSTSMASRVSSDESDDGGAIMVPPATQTTVVWPDTSKRTVIELTPSPPRVMAERQAAVSRMPIGNSIVQPCVYQHLPFKRSICDALMLPPDGLNDEAVVANVSDTVLYRQEGKIGRCIPPKADDSLLLSPLELLAAGGKSENACHDNCSRAFSMQPPMEDPFAATSSKDVNSRSAEIASVIVLSDDDEVDLPTTANTTIQVVVESFPTLPDHPIARNLQSFFSPLPPNPKGYRRMPRLIPREVDPDDI
eukprot:GILI01023332.1.p1 GENE.GILI01023332.1~~GILI01023332.1.p1  ORF type:complete len:327 (+),score=37.05 GILI01023332.1:81-1061(+)